MIHTNNPIIKHKAVLFNLAEEPGNVSKACKVVGVSEDTFYRYQELVEDCSIDNLINKSRRTPNPKNSVDVETEQALAAYAIQSYVPNILFKWMFFDRRDYLNFLHMKYINKTKQPAKPDNHANGRKKLSTRTPFSSI